MDSFDDDMFALSDEDLPIPTLECNPIEEQLMKEYSNVQRRIEKATNDIKELQDTTKHILKSLQYRAQYGENETSDSDSDVSHSIITITITKTCNVEKNIKYFFIFINIKLFQNLLSFLNLFFLYREIYLYLHILKLYVKKVNVKNSLLLIIIWRTVIKRT